MPPEREEISDFIDAKVVLDTSTPYVYVGTLKEWGENFVTLADVDVHDTSAGGSGKDRYVLDSRHHGVRSNRRQTMVRKPLIVSVSRVEDVIPF